MGLIRDTRGQSVVIGSLLIFTVLILAFSGYQAFAVPDQNAQVEAEHFQTVEDQFARLQGGVVNAVGDTDTRSTSIALGTQYPSRAFALNPPPAAGRLETTAPGDVEFDTSDNVCRAGSANATTQSLVYTPGYNEFGEPRAVGYEGRVLSREFEGGILYDQRLVRSGGTDEISLYLLNGSVDENGVSSYSLELNGSNRHTTTLTNPNITLPSRFDNTTWEEDILADRSNVTATDVGDRVELNFTGGDYRVSCAVVGLDGDPAFSPPSDTGTDGSTGTSGDAAYSTEWLDPSGEPGTSCSDTQCTLDASVSKTLGLTAGTTPAAQDATVSFSVSNSTVGTVAPATNETDSEGNASTRLEAGSNGTMKMYAASGGSGDVINITVENLIPFRGAVFTDGTENVTTANSTGTNTLAAEASVLGPLVADIDGDGDDDIPYVPSDGSKVHIVDRDENVMKLSSNKASGDKSLLGVGRWDGAQTSVYFADEDQSKIYRTNPSEGDIGVVNPNGVDAVAGPANIDSDDANELVYAGSSQKLKYLEPGAEPDGNEGTEIYDKVGKDKGIGLGRPADFDGDDTARIPMVDGSGNLLLVDSNGNGPELVEGVDKAPVAAVDWDEDGKLEIMYLDSGELKYVDNVTGSPTVKDTEVDNAEKATGVT